MVMGGKNDVCMEKYKRIKMMISGELMETCREGRASRKKQKQKENKREKKDNRE